MADFSYIGKGKFLIAPYDATGGLRPIGNVSNLEISVAEEEKFIGEFQSSGGGKANSIRRITGVSLNVSMIDRIAENIALAFKGSTTSVTGAAVVSEVHKGWHGKYFVLDKPIGVTAIVVKDITDVTTYSAVTDYNVASDNSITVLSTGTITDGQVLHVSYSFTVHNRIETLTNSGIEYKGVFMGLNEAQSDKQVIVTIHRLKFGAASAFALISDDFSPMDIIGEALSDGTIVTAGLSKYFKVQQGEV